MEPATFRFVAKCLNQLRHRVFQSLEDGELIFPFEISGANYPLVRHHITEKGGPELHRCENINCSETEYNTKDLEFTTHTYLSPRLKKE
jgi:hypothetical protein